MRIAVEGCMHGDLDNVYSTLQYLEKAENTKIDLLICCGDFQAVRNENDLESLNVKPKYRSMNSFWKYYSGQEVAPIPTIFIGGNHEASNYLWELYYGGWAAPNIYFLGFAGVIKFGNIRIGGLSGIYNPRHYSLGHYERVPYNESDIRSIYHVREYDVYKLMQVEEPIDIFVSHDWPLGITDYGNCEQLVRQKPFFEKEIQERTLGSKAAAELLDMLKPPYWFSAHLHCKFPAIVQHGEDGPVTKFLALDKCLPGRNFLQIIEIESGPGPYEIQYDEEWLAITRKYNSIFPLTRKPVQFGDQHPDIQDHRQWVRSKLNAAGARPFDFVQTVAPYDPSQPISPYYSGPSRNPQTELFLQFLELPYLLDDMLESTTPTHSPSPSNWRDRTSSSSMDEASEDICSSILSRYHSSPLDHHQHLCAAVGAISQELKDHSLPLTPISYFSATISSLDRLSASSPPSDPIVDALLTFLSIIMPKVSTAVVRTKGGSVATTVCRILGFGSVAAVKAGLKCISHLMIVGEKGNWESVAPVYGVLLGFVTDNRPKVRKHSHSCLRDVLQSFQGSAILASASEAITNVFERSLLLAGGSNPTSTTSEEGPKGAMEVLYILSALRDSLPLMSAKFCNSILKYFKSLLELQQPIVTRHIMNTLHLLCSSQQCSHVAPELILDLLCLLATSFSVREKSVDVLTSTARLLHVGIAKVHAINRKVCVVKLPIIFNALAEALACEHEEAIFAATEALKGLISTCIDESLINQGVDQIKLNSEGGTRRSGPTIIEKICATIESLLGYQYIAVWDTSFMVVSTMFDILGESSMHLMRGTVKNLADIEKLPDEELAYRKQLHECVGSALGAMGPEIFLSLLPLKLDAEDLSEANVWLFPILKQYTVGARLSFFTRSILGLVELVRKKSQKLEKEGKIFSSRSTEALVYSLWSLLPAFCNYPVDTARSFEGLTNALCNALREEGDLRGVICSSLQILIQQNKRILEGNTLESDSEISVAEQRARARYTTQVATDNLNAIKSSSPQFFSVLSGIFLRSLSDSGGCLQSTICTFASISDKKAVKRFFTNTMQKLLKVTQEAVKIDQSTKSNSMQIDGSNHEISPSLARAHLLDLAVSFLPGLDAKEVDLLFVAIKPALQDEGVVQKKAYKILSIILRERGNDFLSSKLDDLLEMMIELLPSCHFSAKRHRLDSLYFLTVYVSKGGSEQRKRDVIGSFLTEIILALKEANKKTRNRAYDLLVKIGHACGDETQGGKKENLQLFFNMVAGGLAGETPHMISAAVKGLARLAYEFSDLITAAYNLLPSTFLLLQRKNKEIIKANLGLMKVLVAKSQAEGLQTHLKSMVEGLLKWQDDTKSHFKAKVKLLLEMLVRKCGLDAVKAVMPEEHMKLLTNIRKTKERKERKLASQLGEETKSLHSRASTSRFSRWSHTNVFSDFGEDTDDSDAEHMDGKTVSGRGSKTASTWLNSKASSRSIRKRQAPKSLPEDLFDQMEDDPLDLLDRQKTRSSLRSSNPLKRKAESDDEPEIDSDGRLVIHEDRKSKKQETMSDRETDARSQAGSHLTTRTSGKAHKRQKGPGLGWAYTGSEYRSKKAGGDLKRKDKLEPYAYWPLDRRMISRRGEQKAVARKGMASVMKLTKKLEGKSASSALSLNGLKFKRKQKGSKSK